MNDFDLFSRAQREEHAAWVHLCRELTTQVDPGVDRVATTLNHDDWKPFFAAVKRWGERLVLLRQFQEEEIIVRARGEAELQYDRLRTIPEVEL